MSTEYGRNPENGELCHTCGYERNFTESHCHGSVVRAYCPGCDKPRPTDDLPMPYSEYKFWTGVTIGVILSAIVWLLILMAVLTL